MTNRLPLKKHTITQSELIQFFKTRSLQFLESHLIWDNKVFTFKYGHYIKYIHEYTNELFYYFHVLNKNSQYREEILDEINKISKSNKVMNNLKCLNSKYERFDFNEINSSTEYNIITSYYNNQKAKRSQVYLMNHIDEGIVIIENLKRFKKYGKNIINKLSEIKGAYCLHPIIQGDAYASRYKSLSKRVDAFTLGLAIEYRYIANAYLSKRIITSLDDIELSQIEYVNAMLIADKIQNYKDFLLYHKDTHERRNELDEYFNNWIDKLDCRDVFEWYIQYSKHLNDDVVFIDEQF